MTDLESVCRSIGCSALATGSLLLRLVPTHVELPVPLCVDHRAAIVTKIRTGLAPGFEIAE